jgi:hypothetical protein
MQFLPVFLSLFGFGGSYVVPLEHDAIQYAKHPVSDPIAKINGSQFEWEDGHGYLRSVLRRLNVPVESQVLVFSKTSFQASRIGPVIPRAIYFNDSVTVGFVRGGDVIEVASTDPKQGSIFYTLDQDPKVPPRFERRDTCLQCHQSGATTGVPGLLVRSVYPERSGMPLFQAGSFTTDHRSPLKQRWGGWYVTGAADDSAHMGNRIVPDRNAPDQLTDKVAPFDPGAYLSSGSDIVALMVLEHQTHMTNLLTRLGWETRMALHTQAEMNRLLKKPEGELSESAERRIASGVDEVAGYMMFKDEAPIDRPVKGKSAFAAKFASLGPRDKNNRSLRDFDLNTRLFRYPLSYMIYSEVFDSLPAPARDRLLRRIWDELKAGGRDDVIALLRDTKQGLPSPWNN